MQPQTTIGTSANRATLGWHPPLAPQSAPAAAPDFKSIDAIGTVTLAARDQEIYAEGEAAPFCYRVVAGAVRTLKLLPDGRRQILEFHLPGDLLGFDDDETRYLSAEAACDTTLIRYARRHVETLAATDAGLARKLRDLAAAKLRACRKQILLLGRMSAQERIATFLLDVADRAPRDQDGTIGLMMSRSDIADHLGLTLETVSRVLHRLHRDGLIKLVSAHRVGLADRDALDEMAGRAPAVVPRHD